MSAAIKKVNMIARIVHLRQLVRRWKTKSRRSTTTPSGSLAIYVGPHRLRFVVPTRFIHLPVFLSLLHQAEEEFGFHSSGALALPCDPVFFAQILRFLHQDEERFRSLPLDDFLKLASESAPELFDQSSCKESSSSAGASQAFAPLLPKTTTF